MIYELDPNMREIAERLIEAYPDELGHINPDLVLFYHERSYKKDPGGAAARCRKLPGIVRQALADAGKPVHWIIEFYSFCTQEKGPKWLQLLMYHELKHIGWDDRIIEHDIMEFVAVLARGGIDWYNTSESDLPDIVSERIEIGA
jgi:hypothetical protein